MPETYTATAAAEKIGCHKASVTRAATAHGIGRRHGPTWIFTAADLKKLRRLIRETRGNPNFVTKRKTA